MDKKRNKIEKIIEAVSTIHIRPMPKFVSGDYFRLSPGFIACMNNEFINRFLRSLSGGKIYKPTKKQKIGSSRLLKDEWFVRVIKLLGGDAIAETTLAEMFALMEMHKNGEKVLLTGGRYGRNAETNVFFVRDIRGVVHSIGLARPDGWEQKGWIIVADLNPSPYFIGKGCLIFHKIS